MKLQVITLAAKQYLAGMERADVLMPYIFSLAKYDSNYDVRDRVRRRPVGRAGTSRRRSRTLTHGMSVPPPFWLVHGQARLLRILILDEEGRVPSLHEAAKQLLFAEKSVPQAEAFATGTRPQPAAATSGTGRLGVTHVRRRALRRPNRPSLRPRALRHRLHVPRAQLGHRGLRRAARLPDRAGRRRAPRRGGTPWRVPRMAE